MKLTKNQFRRNVGAACLLLGLTILAAANWQDFGASLAKFPTWSIRERYAARDKSVPFVAGASLLTLGVFFWLEFAGDRPIPKDPWEQ